MASRLTSHITANPTKKVEKSLKFPLTRTLEFPIIMRLFRRKTVGAAHGGITQLVEYPVHTRYVICSNQIAATRPVGQAVKTPPFHGGNMGSIPVRVTMKFSHRLLPVGFFHARKAF